ncbi:MAG TPA: Rnase Y domain-containing protein, partial [Ktedonobacterales bacterium]
MNPVTEVVIVVLIAAAIFAYFGYRFGQSRSKATHEQALREAVEQAEARLVALQDEQRTALREARDESKNVREAAESESRQRRTELQRQEQRLTQKEEAFDRRTEQFERRERTIGQRESQLDQRNAELDTKQVQLEKLTIERQRAIEQVAQMSIDEARAEVLKRAEETSRRDAARIARSIEAETRERAEEIARGIITLAIQRCASDQVSDVTITAVPIPNEDMKGRVIGREGRNIRTLEAATGVDVIIDDTPDAVTLSSFDPVRREIARLALQKLILDGRIQPARIEEMVGRARGEVDRVVEEEGQRACTEANINNFP